MSLTYQNIMIQMRRDEDEEKLPKLPPKPMRPGPDPRPSDENDIRQLSMRLEGRAP